MKLYAVVKVYEANGQMKVEVPFCSDDVPAVQKERERLMATRAPGTVIATVEVGSYALSMAGMSEVADTYDYELIRISVQNSLVARYPGLDEFGIGVQRLIDDLTDRAYANIHEGADEDEGVSEAFQALKEDIIRICERED